MASYPGSGHLIHAAAVVATSSSRPRWKGIRQSNRAQSVQAKGAARRSQAAERDPAFWSWSSVVPLMPRIANQITSTPMSENRRSVWVAIEKIYSLRPLPPFKPCIRAKNLASPLPELPNNLTRTLVFPQTEKDWLAQSIIPRPIREFHFANNNRFNPNAPSHFGDG